MIGTLLAVLATVVSLVGCAAPAHAETADAILARVRELDDGPRAWKDRSQKVRLHIVDAAGRERVRDFESFSKRDPNGDEKALLFFESPPELRGTGFLQLGHRGAEDEQWLHLAELKRTRQIAARAKRESFVGTDFSYRDLEIMNDVTRWTTAEAGRTLEGEETIGSTPTWRIAFTPNDADAVGYTTVRLWLRKDDLAVIQAEMLGPDGPEKRLTLSDIRLVGTIPTPHRLEMTTLATGGHTLVEVREVAYDRGLGDDLFTLRALERGQP